MYSLYSALCKQNRTYQEVLAVLLQLCTVATTVPTVQQLFVGVV